MSLDIRNSWLDTARAPGSAGLAVADVFGSRSGARIFGQECALGVEDHQAVDFLDSIDDLAGERVADLELGASGKDGAVVTNTSHPPTVVTNRDGRLRDAERRAPR